MIDHLLCFPNEAAAMAACPAYVIDDDGVMQWDRSRCIPGVAVEVPTGQITEATEDELARPIMVRVPGFWVAIATPAVDFDLMALPQCRVVSDRTAIAESRNHFVHIADDVDPDILARAVVSPVFAGSRYTF